ncbi:unnamed protein product [Malus baccata var. baccata]
MLCLFGFCEAISCLGFTRGRRRGEGKLSRSKERHCGGNVSSCAKRGILYRLQSTTSLHFCRKDSLNSVCVQGVCSVYVCSVDMLNDPH